MKTIELNINIELCQYDELCVNDKELVDNAIRATQNSYSPYSHFCVGASVRLSDGSIIIGANQENAAYPDGLCAERTAIFAAQAQHPELAITSIAIAAVNTESELTAKPVSPCGSCRQVMLEIEERYHQPMRILLYGTDGIYIIHSVRDILPLCFVADDMGA